MADAKTRRFDAAPHWTVFSQIRTQDHDTLPAVLTRQQIHDLLGRIRLRRFLPEFLKKAPALSKEQRRAIWAITHCRTPALGGRAFGCQPCGTIHFAYHSCNHKACPQCGDQATRRWVHRELGKLGRSNRDQRRPDC